MLYTSIFVAFNALCQTIIYTASVLNLRVVALCCGRLEFERKPKDFFFFFKIREVAAKDFAIDCTAPEDGLGFSPYPPSTLLSDITRAGNSSG